MKYIVQRVNYDRGYLQAMHEQIPDLIEMQDTEWSLEYAERFGFPPAFASFMECIHVGFKTKGGYVHLEDDVILCENFTERIEAKIKEVGDMHVIRFFSRDDDIGGFGKYVCWNQCSYFPQWACGAIIWYFENMWSKRKKPALNEYSTVWYWDWMVNECLQRLNQDAYICVPSYVNHAVSPSTLGDRKKDRQCGVFVDDK